MHLLKVSSRPMYSPSDLIATGLHTRSFCHLVNTLTPIDYSIWQSWRSHKEEILALSSKTFIYIATKDAQKWYISQLDN